MIKDVENVFNENEILKSRIELIKRNKELQFILILVLIFAFFCSLLIILSQGVLFPSTCVPNEFLMGLIK